MVQSVKIFYLSEMKWITLFLSFFFLVTHELIPHRHHEELSAKEHEKEHQEAQDVIDFFSLVFHQNLGNHHLQEVIVAQPKDYSNAHQSINKAKASKLILNSLASKPLASLEDAIGFETENEFFNSNFFKNNPLRRGPPKG